MAGIYKTIKRKLRLLEKILFINFLKLHPAILNSRITSQFLSQFGVELRYFTKFSEFKNYDPERVLINNEKLITYIHSAPCFWPINFSKYVKPSVIIEKRNIRDYYINDVKVIGGSNLLLINNNRAIYEIKDFNTTGKYYFLDRGLIAYDDEKCFIRGINTHKKIESGIKLVTNFSHNYYHVLYEVIPKLIKLKINDTTIPLIVDDILLKVPQYKILLDTFNKDKREYIPLRNGVKNDVENLYYLSDVMICPPKYSNYENVSPRDFQYDMEVLGTIRNVLLESKQATNSPKRIFISRPDKRCRNENEILEFLKPYGFTVVKPEKLSLFEQISLFNNAEIIVGTTGAAFSNLIFCNEECKVICLTNYNLNFSGFSTIAGFVGVKLIYIYETEYIRGEKVSLHDSFEIDLEKFRELFFSMEFK